jgi:hypothetical protein
MALEPPTTSPQPDPLSSPSSQSDSSDSSLPAQSRLLRRPPRFTSKHDPSESNDNSDDEEPAFMPFAEPTHQDPSATLRGDPRITNRRNPPTHKKSITAVHQSQTSDSSASSAALTPARARPEATPPRHKFTGPLSPRRTAELAGRSPISKGKGREGSDGTPSMGSSFSDLDGMIPHSTNSPSSVRCVSMLMLYIIDASVTQSALEEALASNMQAGGGMASRMSSISQALRSKYLN